MISQCTIEEVLSDASVGEKHMSGLRDGRWEVERLGKPFARLMPRIGVYKHRCSACQGMSQRIFNFTIDNDPMNCINFFIDPWNRRRRNVQPHTTRRHLLIALRFEISSYHIRTNVYEV